MPKELVRYMSKPGRDGEYIFYENGTYYKTTRVGISLWKLVNEELFYQHDGKDWMSWGLGDQNKTVANIILTAIIEKEILEKKET